MKRQRCTTPSTVTIASRYYEYEAAYHRRRPERAVPAIRLAGDWLKKHGFTTGAKVNVTVETGRLVLTVAE